MALNFVTPRPDYYSSKFKKKEEQENPENSLEIILMDNLEIIEIGPRKYMCPICEKVSRARYIYNMSTDLG